MTTVRIGLISDTHGLLRPEALAPLRGCERIVHAGDVGDARILEALAAIAPVTAVRGNNDFGPWAERLREIEVVRVGTIAILVIHDESALDFEASDTPPRVVVAGHSHRPSVVERGEVLYVNPGSAGPRRFHLPVSVGELRVGEDGTVSARIVELEVAPSRPTPRS